jgi:hypothetical protein
MSLTRIVWAGGDHPSPGCPVQPGTRVGPPAIAVLPFDSIRGGADPCTIPEGFPDLIDGVEIRDLAVVRPTPPPAGMVPVAGIGVAWTRDLRVARVASSGFQFAISIEWSDDWTVEGSVLSATQVNLRTGLFGGPPLAVKPHNYGGVLRDNRLGPTPNGFNISNAIGAEVTGNTVRASDVGFFLLGGRDHVVHHNVFLRAAGPGRGWLVNVAQIASAAIHHNVVCDFMLGLRLSDLVATAAAQGWTSRSTGINFHHNRLFGVADDHDVIDEAFIGTYQVHANTEGASAACPTD